MMESLSHGRPVFKFRTISFWGTKEKQRSCGGQRGRAVPRCARPNVLLLLKKKNSRNGKSTPDGQLTPGERRYSTSISASTPSRLKFSPHPIYGKSCQRRYSTVLTFLLENGRPDQRDGAGLLRAPTRFDCCDLSDGERISRNALSRAAGIDSSSLRQAVRHVLCSLHHSSNHASPGPFLQLSWARCRS